MIGEDDDHEHHGNPHARNTDPDTSHEAVPSAATRLSHCLRLLRFYETDSPLIDHKACAEVGLDYGNGGHQRCSDLRDSGFIDWTGDKEKSPFNKRAGLCEITPIGRSYLEALNSYDPLD